MNKKSGKGILWIGLAIAGFAVIAMLAYGRMVNPPSVTAYVAGQDITQGTLLSELPDTAFQAVPLKGTDLTGPLVTKAELSAMRTSGGAFVTNVAKGDPIMNSAIASSSNEAGAVNPSLANADPNMVIAHLIVTDIVPEGIRVGDRIDLAVAVTSIRFDESYALSVANLVAKATKDGQGTDQFSSSVTADDYNSASLAGGSDLLNDSDMVKYYFQAPLAKTIVQNAKVINVIRESGASYSSTGSGTGAEATASAGGTTSVEGAVQAIDVLIPRASFEWVAMAHAGGELSISLVSPMADVTAPPTMGVSLQDLIDTFYSSRGLSVEDTITKP